MIGRKAPTAPVRQDLPRGFDSFEVRLGDVMRGERATMGKSLLDVQRDLRIKAGYVAAIENSDPSVFESKGFVAGYVRSYARYLNLDPEWAFARFCEESNFEGALGKGVGTARPAPKLPGAGLIGAGFGGRSAGRAPVPASEPLRDPLAGVRARQFAASEGVLSRLQPAALGSSAVLLALIGALGYGGWAVLREIQRVDVVPVDQAPGVVATLDPLDAALAPRPGSEVSGIAMAAPDPTDRLYRPQALDVPVLVARDGPIATLDPDAGGSFAQAAGERPASLALAPRPPEETPVQVVAEAPPAVEVFAIRPAWVRISRADGTVLFEKILDAGERYVLPETDGVPLLRAGNSGSVFFAVNGQTYGPAGPGTQVAKNVALSPDAIPAAYALADVPAEFRAQDRPAVAENAAGR
jgi:hypothetical protein